nr:MFS transporter [Rubricella aquisinus]
MYALIFAALGAHLPFWPLWLEDWGLTATEIGSFTAAGVVVRILAGIAIPALADRLDARRMVMAGVAALGAVVFTAHLWIDDKAILFLATLATGLVYPGMIPLSDALGSAAAREYRFAYAQARAFGSLAFLIANIAVGWLIGQYGVGVALWWIVICLALSVWMSMIHPGGGQGAELSRPRLTDIGKLATAPVFVLFLCAIGFAQGSHAVFYAFGSVHWAGLGLNEGEIGALWAFSVAVEVVLMFTVGAAIVARIGAVPAIAFSGAVGVLRWTWMMFDPTGAELWFLQFLHSGTFAIGHLGAIAFVAAAVEERLSASAQGLFGAAFGGLLSAVAMGLASVFYASHGGATYGIAAVMSGLGLIFALMLHHRWQGGLIATRKSR